MFVYVSLEEKFCFAATVTISLPPEPNTITVNKTHFVHCVASYQHQLDVTYHWYHSEMLIDFEIIYRLGENKYEIWRNPHYKRVGIELWPAVTLCYSWLGFHTILVCFFQAFL